MPFPEGLEWNQPGVEPTQTKKNEGWLPEEKPPAEYFNWLFNRICLATRFLNENKVSKGDELILNIWKSVHLYTVGDICYSTNAASYKYFECVVAGISGTNEPTWPAVGQILTEGTCQWKVYDIRQGTTIGRIPGLVDVGEGKAGLPSVSGKNLTDILLLAGGTLTGVLKEKTGANIASATTLNLNAATGNLVHITGTTTITAVTLTAGAIWCVFDGILTLTHSATANNLPGAADITTAVGDRALYWSDGTTVYCMHYQKANGQAVYAKYAPSEFGLGNSVILNDVDANNYKSTGDFYFYTGCSNLPEPSYMQVHVSGVGTDSAQIAISTLTGKIYTRIHSSGWSAWEQVMTTGQVGNGICVDENGVISQPITILNDTQLSGTNGGTFTSGAWRTRTLNTKVADQIGVVLNSNQFTLTAGVYEIDAAAPGYATSYHKARLQNITDGTTDAVGSAETDAVAVTSCSRILCLLTLSSTKVFELQHYCSATRATDGFGGATSIAGVNEVYSQIKIKKVG